MKKSTVLPGDGAKNSHVFSDMYLQRAEKVIPKIEKKKKEPQNLNKYSFDQEYASNISKNNSELSADINTSNNLPQGIPRTKENKLSSQ